MPADSADEDCRTTDASGSLSMIIKCLRCGVSVPAADMPIAMIEPVNGDMSRKLVKATNANDIKCPRCDTPHEIMIRATWSERT
jgi:DNA-directed RNA polymerase subunit RPC12/RpoP